MEVQAIARNIRISPRKVRIVADLIRGKSAGEALSILRNTPKAASSVVGPGRIAALKGGFFVL